MTLEAAITKKRVVDFRLFSDQLYYSGVCLHASRQLLVLANYDDKQQALEGFTIFRNAAFEKYHVNTQKEAPLKQNNTDELAARYPVQRLGSFYSWFRYLQGKTLVAFFTGTDYNTYYVGKITAVTKTQIRVRLMGKKGDWIGYRVFPIASVAYFSFDTQYEMVLSRKSQLPQKK
jgi:hypothetical protein